MNDMDFSYQEEGNQKNDFDFFRFHNWQAYMSLSKVIKAWKPEKQNYDDIKDACQEFLNYYKTQVNQNFPEEYQYRMEELIGIKLGMS